MATIITRKTTSGEITYFVRVRRKGSKTSCATFKRKSDAQRWISELEQSIREGRYFERVEGKRHTVAEAIDRYNLEHELDESESRKTRAA